ncbi:MAG: non-canonical purine NTP pyrophosphatase, partial [Gemmatimonadetes bacterium]|nr:non-canonical purine NTP pyrophosphatase [Gemmatimonadota bacterium]
MTELLLATRSRHKLQEIREILAPVPGLRVVDLVEAGVPETAEEDGLEPYDTFEENAESKA